MPLFLLALALASGCAAPGSRCTSVPRRWIRANGGLVESPDAARLQRVCAPLLQACGGDHHAVFLLNSPSVTAYAWPQGAIYVTRGLYDLAHDDELAAAVAHELGHLLDDGHLSTRASLASSSNTDPEIRADALGCCLLTRCGVAPSALLTLLDKVRAAPSTGAEYRGNLAARIQALRSNTP